MKKAKTGLVLGGGGARGLAHIGVIKVLQSAGINIDIICGSSMGAFIGAMYALNPDALRVEEKVLNFLSGPEYRKLGVNNFRQKKQRDPDDILRQLTKRVQRRVVLNLAANRIALLKSNRLRMVVESLLPDTEIEKAKIPFACTATDLVSGQGIVFKEGSIRQAVESSSAIPGFIPPVRSNGRLLIDGSVTDNFPVNTASEMGADFTVVVDVSLDFDQDAEVSNVVDLVMRSALITGHKLNNILKNQADVIIRPEVGHIHWSEFTRVSEIIEAGACAAKEQLPEIKQKLRKLSSPIRTVFDRSRRKRFTDEKL